MSKQKKLKIKNHRVHFLGICGISMSALALKLNDLGFKVSGSDSNPTSQICEILSKQGITINEREHLLNSDTIVYSSAISQSDEKFEYAKKAGKNLISRAELLNEISKTYKTFVGIAGTHGKTTCTSIIAHIFNSAKLPFDMHLGGLDKKFGNYYCGGNQIFLSELCEYKKNLSHFSPDYSVVLNIDNDHLESYGSFESLRTEFYNFASRSGVCIYSDQTGFKGIKNGVCFSLKNPNEEYYLRMENKGENFGECAVYEHGAPLLKININKFMPHDINNILASVALSRSLGLSCESIVNGIKDFECVARRNEVIYKCDQKLIIADYAHHPSQIQLAVQGYTKKLGKCNFLFQPHTYSRTRDLFNQFVKVLSSIPNLYLFKTYGARERYEYLGSAERLHQSIQRSIFCGDVSNAESVVNELIGGDLPIIVLGAGDIYEHVNNAIAKLKCH